MNGWNDEGVKDGRMEGMDGWMDRQESPLSSKDVRADLPQKEIYEQKKSGGMFNI